MDDTPELFCVIMAGGSGTRLWPLSQESRPKQFLDLVNLGRTMLQITYDRYARLCDAEHVVIVTLDEYREIIHEQLPDVPLRNILCEPFRRNTAVCIALVSAYLRQVAPNSVMIVTPADHLLLNRSAFVRSVSGAADYAAQHDELLTIGIKAFRPETAFGYIQVGEQLLDAEQVHIHRVRTFTEKPNLEMAQLFFQCGDFCWNSGVFVWRRDALDSAMHRFLPQHADMFDALDDVPYTHWGEGPLRNIYEHVESISIDYGILEKARNVVVSLSEAVWSDLGSWESLYEQSAKDAADNAVLTGHALLKDTRNCLVRCQEGNVVVVEGLDDFMVVQQGNVTIVCPRKNARTIWSYQSEVRDI